MTWRVVLLGLMAAGCSGTDGTDDESGEDTDQDTDNPSVHPLVPDDYNQLWNTEGCTTQDGNDGAQVYWLVDDARQDANGNFTATERWYWFWSEPGWARDCIDTWEIRGRFAQFDYGQLECVQCDEGFTFTRTMTDATCDVTYYSIFDLTDQPEEEVYDGVVLFDIWSPMGNLNERMLVVHGAEVEPNRYAMNPNYGWGAYAPDDGEGEPQAPADYTWLGQACIGTSD